MVIQLIFYLQKYLYCLYIRLLTINKANLQFPLWVLVRLRKRTITRKFEESHEMWH